MQVSLLAAALAASPIAFDRVDIVSEDPGLWLNYDVPAARAYPISTGVRLLKQVKPVVRIVPVEGLYAGVSLQSQSVTYEGKLLPQYGLTWSAGVQTRLLLPTGAFGGVAWRVWRMRFGLGVSAISAASWARPDWTNWKVLPTVGIGIGRLNTWGDGNL